MIKTINLKNYNTNKTLFIPYSKKSEEKIDKSKPKCKYKDGEYLNIQLMKGIKVTKFYNLM